jgi:hypothetical protein
MKIGAVMGPIIAIIGAIGCKIYSIGKTSRTLELKDKLKGVWWTFALLGSVLGIITTPILSYISLGLSLPMFRLVPIYRGDIAGLMIFASIIMGLLIGSSIGLLKWLRKIRKPLMYPIVIGGLLFIFFLLWAIGTIK